MWGDPSVGSPVGKPSPPPDPGSQSLCPFPLSCTGGGGDGGHAPVGDAVPSSDVPSPLGAPGMVWGAFIQLHGLAGP